jgi:hypothetical protein
MERDRFSWSEKLAIQFVGKIDDLHPLDLNTALTLYGAAERFCHWLPFGGGSTAVGGGLAFYALMVNPGPAVATVIEIENAVLPAATPSPAEIKSGRGRQPVATPSPRQIERGAQTVGGCERLHGPGDSEIMYMEEPNLAGWYNPSNDDLCPSGKRRGRRWVTYQRDPRLDKPGNEIAKYAYWGNDAFCCPEDSLPPGY